LLFPPLSVADEPGHFYRAVAITSGELLAERRPDGKVGAVLPSSLERLVPELGVGELLPREPARRVDLQRVRAALGWPLDPADRRFVEFPTAALYPAVVHLPQALGVAAGRLLGLGPLWLVYLGRAGNLVVCTLVLAAAIRIATLGRWALCLLALTPMAVSSRASLSADGLTTAHAFLLVGAIARLAWGEVATIDRARLLAVLVASLVALTKVPYAVLLLTFAIVPRERWELARHRLLWSLGAGAVLAGLAFSVWTARTYETILRPGVDPGRQVLVAFAEPLRFAVLVAEHYARYLPRYVAQGIGIQLGWLDVRLPVPPLCAYGIVFLGFALLAGTPGVIVRWWQRAVAAAGIAASAVLVAASQYASWTPLRADFIDGVQGRYFLPVAPLLVLALHRRPAGEPPARALALIVAVLHVLVTGVAWWQIARRYYG
jgi:uncharacterized membrane protein